MDTWTNFWDLVHAHQVSEAPGLTTAAGKSWSMIPHWLSCFELCIVFLPNISTRTLKQWAWIFQGCLNSSYSLMPSFWFQISYQFTRQIQTKIKDLLQQMEEGLKTADPHDCSTYTGWTGEQSGICIKAFFFMTFWGPSGF